MEQSTTPTAPTPVLESEEVLFLESPSVARQDSIFFETSSFSLNESSRGTLEGVAVIMKNSSAKALLFGYADPRADALYNANLSRARADAARDYLISLGVDPARVSVAGLGETGPERSSSVEHPEDRRVEIFLFN